jgi:hypothetical protein
MQLREKILLLNEKIKEQMLLKSDNIKNSFEIAQVSGVVLSINNSNQAQNNKLKSLLQKQRKGVKGVSYPIEKGCLRCLDSKYQSYIYDKVSNENISLEDPFFEENNIYLYELSIIANENDLCFVCNRCHNKKDFLKSLK